MKCNSLLFPFVIRTAQKALLLSSALALVVGLPASAAERLNGAGASFPAKIYQRWFADLAKSGGPQVNYQAVGSGSGRKAFIDQTVNFGASDDPMKKKDMAMVGRGVVQIPMVGGTIAFGYNKPGCNLKLTQEQAVKVAMGMIKNWKELGCQAGTLTWVLAYNTDNGADAAVVKEAFNYMLSDAAQNKASSLGFVPSKGDILAKSKAAINKIGK